MNQREMLLADVHHWNAYQLGPDARLSAREVTSLCDTLLMSGWTRPEDTLTQTKKEAAAGELEDLTGYLREHTDDAPLEEPVNQLREWEIGKGES